MLFAQRTQLQKYSNFPIIFFGYEVFWRCHVFTTYHLFGAYRGDFVYLILVLFCCFVYFTVNCIDCALMIRDVCDSCHWLNFLSAFLNCSFLLQDVSRCGNLLQSWSRDYLWLFSLHTVAQKKPLPNYRENMFNCIKACQWDSIYW